MHLEEEGERNPVVPLAEEGVRIPVVVGEGNAGSDRGGMAGDAVG